MNQRNILIRDVEGHIAAIEGIFTDLTSRKKAEKQTRRLQNYLSNIFDSMPSVLVGCPGVTPKQIACGVS